MRPMRHFFIARSIKRLGCEYKCEIPAKSKKCVIGLQFPILGMEIIKGR